MREQSSNTTLGALDVQFEPKLRVQLEFKSEFKFKLEFGVDRLDLDQFNGLTVWRCL